MRRLVSSDFLLIFLLVLVPIVSHLFGADSTIERLMRSKIGDDFSNLFILAVLALALNVVVGYAGQLHLGIAAYFGVGAYVAAILLSTFRFGTPWEWHGRTLPGSVGFLLTMAVAGCSAALLCAVTSAPILRLRGDYLALVTLGFGEVVRYALINLEEITSGNQGISGLPTPDFPEGNWQGDYRYFYYVTLTALFFVLIFLRNLEKSRLGRAWVALREDELAASCMGLDTAKLKLLAFTLAGGLAGLAGALHAIRLQGTQPQEFNFQKSIIILSGLILGGMGNRTGVILGVFLLVGFDNIFAPAADKYIQQSNLNASGASYLYFSSWRLMVFGVALILIMRIRPEGLLPASRIRAELHNDEPIVEKPKEAQAPVKEG